MPSIYAGDTKERREHKMAQERTRQRERRAWLKEHEPEKYQQFLERSRAQKRESDRRTRGARRRQKARERGDFAIGFEHTDGWLEIEEHDKRAYPPVDGGLEKAKNGRMVRVGHLNPEYKRLLEERVLKYCGVDLNCPYVPLEGFE